MPAAVVLASLLVLPASAASSPEAAAVSVLSRMRATLRYAPDYPSERGPHEWTGRRALKAGTINGCVESAKAFQALYRDAVPGGRAVLIDSFDAAADGGHAVVELTGSDGVPFLVDAASFERLPGAPALDDADLERPLDISPDRKGRVYQFAGRADVFVERAGGRYRLTEYPYASVFSKARRTAEFTDLSSLRAAVAAYDPVRPDFRWLRDHGLILTYDDASRTGFLYAGAAGTTRHVVYACRAEEPGRDDAVAAEPAARERYARTGRGGCPR